ncbi:MAG: Ig-like domain-containing protein, partial [Dehalococcoidales bacterium]|nr:Ig-like domain-containing protein [Dehalococcoidales bacterium]
QQFTATGTYSNATTANITSQVTWTSSNTSAATISAAGLATGVAVGNTTVRASLSGVNSTAVSLTVVVAVNQTANLTSIAVTPASPANLAVNATQQFTATGTYSNNTTVNITSQVNWTSSNTSVATISAAGLATGVAVGNTTIRASLSGVNSTAVSLTVVVAPTLTSIVITPASPSNLAIGATQQFTATGTYSNNTTANITSLVTWASSNTSIATISAAGLATGVAVGNTTIVAALLGVNSTAVILYVVIP